MTIWKAIMKHWTMLVAAMVTCVALTSHGATPSAASRRGDWPGFRGPNHNGVIDERLDLLPSGPKKLWEAQVTTGHASMAIVQGRLYTFGGLGGRRDTQNLVCLDAQTGRPVWTRNIETHFGNSTPWIENGRLYLAAAMDDFSTHPAKKGIAIVYCCDAATGNVLWSRRLPPTTGDRQYGLAGSPLLWEDLVIVNAAGGAALSKSTGEVAWIHEGFPGLATPVLFQWKDRACVALFGGDKLIARDARTGRELWIIPWVTELAVNASDPIILGETVFICSDYGRGRALYDFSAGQPKPVWEFGKGKGSSFSSGFLHQGQLHAFAESRFGCIDTATGQFRWQTDGGVAALLLGDVLVIVNGKGNLRLGRITPTGFQPLAAADLGMDEIKGVPAYSDGKLYIRNEHGRIICLQIATPRR